MGAKKKRSTREVEVEESEGLIARMTGAVGDGLGAIGERTRVARRVVGGLVLVGLASAWILGIGPLEERVAAIQSDPIEVSFQWPTTRGAHQTWVPPTVRADLTQIVKASVSMDPFDERSLERAHDLLIWTGWFTRVDGVKRMPGGIIDIAGQWRTPAAVVSREGRDYLVGVDTAVMRLPEGASAPTGMFRILNPLADAPRDPDSGLILYGRPWHFDDVQHAIDLLELVARLPEADSIVAVDLSDYPRKGHLSLITNTGCRLVWGAPLDEPVPGEASVERKMAHLGAILDPARRLDRGQSRIEIFTDRVVIDGTPGGKSD
jgi:hypothetical protein